LSDTVKRLRGLKDLLLHGVEQGSRQVERIQRGVVDMPFALLEQVPAIAEPAMAVHEVERVVTSTSWKVVRVTSRVVGVVADVALAFARDHAEDNAAMAEITGTPGDFDASGPVA
jgi:hypothetical protein